MRTTDRNPRQLTLFEDPAARRPAPLDLVDTVSSAREVLFAGWTEGLGRAVVRRAPVSRLASRGVGV